MSAKEGMMVGKYTQSQTYVIAGWSKQELTADSGIDHWVDGDGKFYEKEVHLTLRN